MALSTENSYTLARPSMKFSQEKERLTNVKHHSLSGYNQPHESSQEKDRVNKESFIKRIELCPCIRERKINKESFTKWIELCSTNHSVGGYLLELCSKCRMMWHIHVLL